MLEWKDLIKITEILEKGRPQELDSCCCTQMSLSGTVSVCNGINGLEHAKQGPQFL